MLKIIHGWHFLEIKIVRLLTYICLQKLKNTKTQKLPVPESLFNKVAGLQIPWCTYISSHWRCSIKKGILKNFAKFIGKHLCQSLFFNKVAGLRPQPAVSASVSTSWYLKACNFIKKETLEQMFSCEFCEISKNTFFIEHLWWLLLVLESNDKKRFFKALASPTNFLLFVFINIIQIFIGFV